MPNIRHHFKTNIRLKDIIGQGLINNSNIALIELIKNARDAQSDRVEIVFQNANTDSPDSQLIVQDFGTGMSFNDVTEKWLNIAYSEKKETNNKHSGFFAGDKGIGRFSCDRLGRSLDLYTKQMDGKLVHLHVPWVDFEVDDINTEISSVTLTPTHITDKVFSEKTSLPTFSHGTCLIIKDVRETWDKRALERLRKELERFIIDPNKEFNVHLTSYDFKADNGTLLFDEVIENKLLAKLDDKTISVHSKIDKDGKLIKTELRHYGDTILSFEEANPYSELKSIHAQIHYLSTAGKISFKAITGYKSADYSSIMFFLNGFRVMPYGEPKDDWLQLNHRKTQGTMRFLGTRELFGIIEAYDNERRLLPVSSREGLENNTAFKQLVDRNYSEKLTAYIPGILNVLEKYVVHGIDWDRVAPKSGNFSYQEVVASIKAVIDSQTKGDKLQKLHVDYEKIKEIAKDKIEKYEEFVADLTKRVSEKSVYELTKSEKRDVKKYVIRHDNALKNTKATNREYKKTIQTEKKKRLFAESGLSSDSKRAKELQHHIGILGDEIYGELNGILLRHSKGEALEVDDILESVRIAYFHVNKLRKVSKVITGANFDMQSDYVHENIFLYIEQYIEKMNNLGIIWGISLKFENPNKLDFKINIIPLELTMLIDNIIDNAVNAEAENLTIIATETDEEVLLKFIDDGNGLTDRYTPEELFSAGISTTDGSGIGLSHLKDIAEHLFAKISISNNEISGATVAMRWDK